MLVSWAVVEGWGVWWWGGRGLEVRGSKAEACCLRVARWGKVGGRLSLTSLDERYSHPNCELDSEKVALRTAFFNFTASAHMYFMCTASAHVYFRCTIYAPGLAWPAHGHSVLCRVVTLCVRVCLPCPALQASCLPWVSTWPTLCQRPRSRVRACWAHRGPHK